MTAKAFLMLPLAEQVRTLDQWDDGDDPEGFKLFVLDFIDNVIFPFQPDSKWEKWTDFFLNTVGGLGFDELADIVRRYLKIITEARLTAGLAAKLPDS